MSKHEAVVFRVEKRPHPNADKLALVEVNGYVSGVRKEDFSDGDLAVLIEPDTCVPVARPEFSFLSGAAYADGEYGGFARITVRRFRGLYSHGLVVKAPDGMAAGDNAFEALGLKHFDPEVANPGRRGHIPDSEGDGVVGFNGKYDLEHLLKYKNLFIDGEEVVVTEKIHGSNMRVGCVDGVVKVGSRSRWVKDSDNVWWNAYRPRAPELNHLAVDLGLTVFGEVVPTQGERWTYGITGSPGFIVFDMLRNGEFIDHDELAKLCRMMDLTMVPELWRGPFSMDKMHELASGVSELAPGVAPYREGCVVRPVKERIQFPVGRCVLKLVSPHFLENEK